MFSNLNNRQGKSNSISGTAPGGQRPSFHKHNTVDNLFASYYGFRGGRLLVQVIEGRDLYSKECNCFCEVSFGNLKEKTRTIGKGEKQAWREEFVFEAEQMVELRVSIWRVCKGPIHKFKILGQTTLTLNKLLDGDIHNEWYDLVHISEKGEEKVPAGQVQLQLQYTSEADRNRDYIVAKDNKAILMKSLLHHDLVLICVLCRTHETEELSKTVIRLYNSEGQALRLLIQLIFRDLKATSNEDLLFRNDTIATKTTRNYFRMIGIEYVHETLSQLIQHVVAFPKGYEVDPARLKPEEVPFIKQHQKNLIHVSNNFLEAIFTSTERVPTNMRKFLNLLRMLVKQCFPAKEIRSIGSIFFLRFLVPAITTPQSYDILPKEVADPEARRALTLIAKMIQNLANDVMEFKEDFMMPMNVFLQSNADRIKNYFDMVSMVPTVSSEDPRRAVFSENDRLKCLALIVGIMIKSMKNFEQKLLEDARMKDQLTIQTVMEQYRELKEVLVKPVDSLDVRTW